MLADSNQTDNTLLPWRGIHHVALSTPDIEAAARFYRDVLAMQVSEIYPSRAGRGRHCLVFVKPGDPDTWGLHFFEREAAPGDRLLHIAFRLPDAATANALRERLIHHKIGITEIPELGSFIFNDNQGMMVEITWQSNT